MSAATGLLKAADYIEKRGWCQGLAIDGAGQVCLVGSLNATIRGVDEYAAAVSALRRHLQVDRLTVWNDTPGRTQAEVVTALRAAAGAKRVPTDAVDRTTRTDSTQHDSHDPRD